MEKQHQVRETSKKTNSICEPNDAQTLLCVCHERTNICQPNPPQSYRNCNTGSSERAENLFYFHVCVCVFSVCLVCVFCQAAATAL